MLRTPTDKVDSIQERIDNINTGENSKKKKKPFSNASDQK